MNQDEWKLLISDIDRLSNKTKLEANKKAKKDYLTNIRAERREYVKQLKINSNCHICNKSFIDCPEDCDFHHYDVKESHNLQPANWGLKKAQEQRYAQTVPMCRSCHNAVHFGNGIGILGRNRPKRHEPCNKDNINLELELNYD